MVAVNFEQVLSNQLGPPWVEHLLQLPQGRASALFVVLAGIGTTFLVGRDLAAGRLVLARRALVLLALGYAFLALAWDADILHFYGFYFLLAIPCLGLGDRWLLVLAVLATLPTPLLLIAGWDYEQGWVLDRLEYVELWTWSGHLRHLVLNGFHPIVPWMAFFLWGMWLGRRLREDPGHARRVALRAAVWALALEVGAAVLVSALGGLDRPDSPAWLVATVSMPPGPLYVLAAAATATALLGLCCLVVERAGEAAPVRALVHTGQLALTVYLAHVIVGLGPFDLWLQLGCLSRWQVLAWWAVFGYLTVLAAHRWRLGHDQGPFEWLLRSIGGQPVRGSAPRSGGSRR